MPAERIQVTERLEHSLTHSEVCCVPAPAPVHVPMPVPVPHSVVFFEAVCAHGCGCGVGRRAPFPWLAAADGTTTQARGEAWGTEQTV